MNVVLKMAFLAFSNANIHFDKSQLNWKSYTSSKLQLTIKQIEIVGKNNFARAAIDENVKKIVIHVAFLLTLHPAKKAQITSLLITKIKIADKDLDYADIFSAKKAAILPEISKLNCND